MSPTLHHCVSWTENFTVNWWNDRAGDLCLSPQELSRSSDTCLDMRQQYQQRQVEREKLAPGLVDCNRGECVCVCVCVCMHVQL